ADYSSCRFASNHQPLCVPRLRVGLVRKNRVRRPGAVNQLACPQCRAAINPELVDDAGRVECPFCNHEWSLLEETPECGIPAPQAREASAGSESLSKKLSPPPAGSLIRIVEALEDRLVLYIPGGGKAATGLGCFALAWNSFMCLFTVPMIWGYLRGG